MKKAIPNRKLNRRGIGRVDVIAVLFVVVLLIVLIVPAVVSRPRVISRKMACLANLRQLGLSTLNFSANAGGDLPAFNDDLVFKNDASDDRVLAVGWPILLLNGLDKNALLRSIEHNSTTIAGETSLVSMAMADSEKVWIPEFTCPDDPNAFRQPGKLSYVVNAGFISRELYHGDPDRLHRPGQLRWNGSEIPVEKTDIEVGFATGVFWRKIPLFKSSLDCVGTGDGSSFTLMMTENLLAGKWYDTDTARIGFGLPVEIHQGQVRYGSGAFFESQSRPLNTEFTGSAISTAKPNDWKINSDKLAIEGTRPRPSSTHLGGVNVIMCDGAGRFLSEKIDPHVYAKLLTQNGASFGERPLMLSEF